MRDMDIQATISRLQDFRQASYQMFDARPDATLGLIDALSTNISARSVVELSLNPYFRFSYNSIYDAIDNFFTPREPEKADEERRGVEKRYVQLIASVLPEPTNRPFWLCTGWDALSAPVGPHTSRSRLHSRVRSRVREEACDHWARVQPAGLSSREDQPGRLALGGAAFCAACAHLVEAHVDWC